MFVVAVSPAGSGRPGAVPSQPSRGEPSWPEGTPARGGLGLLHLFVVLSVEDPSSERNVA